MVAVFANGRSGLEPIHARWKPANSAINKVCLICSWSLNWRVQIGTFKKVQAKYTNPVLFIIDEWLLLKPTGAEQHDILELLHRRRKRSSTIFCSQYNLSRWYDQLGGDDSPLAEAILDRIMHDAYKINIVPTDPSNYRSMREVYGLDPALSE